MISLGPWLLFDFPPSTPSRAENQQQPRSQGNHLSAPCGIIYFTIWRNMSLTLARDSGISIRPAEINIETMWYHFSVLGHFVIPESAR